jgi:hypothetical protein
MVEAQVDVWEFTCIITKIPTHQFTYLLRELIKRSGVRFSICSNRHAAKVDYTLLIPILLIATFIQHTSIYLKYS